MNGRNPAGPVNRPQGEAISDVLVIPAFVGSSELSASVAAHPGGIGFVGQSYAKGPEIKRLQIYDDTPQGAMKPEEAVFPDTAAIQMEGYPQVGRAGLIVEGWADSVGTDEACLKVSLQRAQNVAQYITETLGCKATATGKGKSFDPPNTNEENKKQNRRVVIKSAPGVISGPTPPPDATPAKKKKP